MEVSRKSISFESFTGEVKMYDLWNDAQVFVKPFRLHC